MPARTSDEKVVCLSVCLSVSLSVKRLDCDKTKEKSVQIFTPYERSFSLVFSEKEAWSDPFYLKFCVKLTPLERNRHFQSIFARSASAVAPSKIVQLTLTGSPLCALQSSLRWTSCVAPKPPEGAQKRKTAIYHLKSHFARRKSATKFFCVKTVSDKVVRHSLT